jgi:hypothetical protein
MTRIELETLIAESLRGADEPVDMSAGARLSARVAVRRRARRRTAVLLVAAAAVVAAVLVPWSLSGDGRAEPPVGPIRPSPEVQLAPSGLPVGIIRIPVTAHRDTGQGAAVDDAGSDSTHFEVLVQVNKDGTGQYKVITSSDPSLVGFDVQWTPGPADGDVAMVYGGKTCLTFHFERAGRVVTVLSARATGACLVSPATAIALKGASGQLKPNQTG